MKTMKATRQQILEWINGGYAEISVDLDSVRDHSHIEVSFANGRNRRWVQIENEEK